MMTSVRDCLNLFLHILMLISPVTRAVKGISSTADTTIDAYKKAFTDLQDDFETGATLRTAIVVHKIAEDLGKIKEDVDNIGIHIANSVNNSLTYPSSQEYYLE